MYHCTLNKCGYCVHMQILNDFVVVVNCSSMMVGRIQSVYGAITVYVVSIFGINWMGIKKGLSPMDR